METWVWRVDPEHPEPEVMERAAALLRAGALVAFPTETVYGLGAHALDRRAVARIFAAKGRPADNPLIVHVATADEVASVAREMPETAWRLARRFWPGPLTLVLPRRAEVPDETTGGLETVAVRVPAHPVARALLAAAGVPVAAPSANLSGRPSPTRAEHVWEDLAGRIEAIVDGGPAGVGVESTVLDVTVEPPELLRPGGVPVEALEAVVGPVRLAPELARAAAETLGVAPGEVAGLADGAWRPRSPGMKYRHYAPSVPAVLVEGPAEAVWAQLAELVARERAAGRRVGALVSEEGARHLAARAETAPDAVAVVGPRSRPAEVAARLFAGLRELDRAGVGVIVMEGIEPKGLGLAVMNRLRKAAGGRVIQAGLSGGGLHA